MATVSGVSKRRPLAFYVPTFRLFGFEELDEQFIWTRDHDVAKSGFIANPVAKSETLRFHPLDEFIQIVGLDAEVVNNAFAALGRLVVDVDKGAPKRQSHAAGAGSILIPYQCGAEHRAEEADRRF